VIIDEAKWKVDAVVSLVLAWRDDVRSWREVPYQKVLHLWDDLVCAPGDGDGEALVGLVWSVWPPLVSWHGRGATKKEKAEDSDEKLEELHDAE
jgi:hypothetical protein